MLSESAADVKFEIGHVLFIDIVGYSKLLITEQSEQIQKLKLIVRATEQLRLAEAEGKPDHRATRRRVEDAAGFGRDGKETLRLGHCARLCLRGTRGQGQSVRVAEKGNIRNARIRWRGFAKIPDRKAFNRIRASPC
jgi:hypothetical protein